MVSAPGHVSNGPLWTHGHDADTSAPHHEEDLRPSEASLLIMLRLLVVGDADESSLRKVSGYCCSQEGGLFASLS